MAPVALRHSKSGPIVDSFMKKIRTKIIQNQGGQITIFLGLSMVLILTFVAFIVNVGLFVKAKINLQNAVDASAYAGASVQARQLSNISYLNWEIRNTYKEWMFKYYVLGQKGLTQKFDAQFSGGATKMNFRLDTFYKASDGAYFDSSVFDKYNVPSICIHFDSPHNICGIASVPGLPRFETLGISGISEENESFLNAIVKTKANDCSTRTNLNFGTAMMWAFGDGKGDLFPDIPQIGASRPGAWPQAFELGIRMRNLESIVNFPPVKNGICADPSVGCPNAVIDLLNRYQFGPQVERVSKAFYSGFRNLGGRAYEQDCNGAQGAQSNMACSFTLYELSPSDFQVQPNSLSGFLLPTDADSDSFFNKRYLDLIAYPVNLVNFYSMFLSQTTDFKNSATKSEADCGIIKTALPIPAYLMGFTKNPNVMTYYAVKGKAKFVGLMFPFKDQTGIELTAYAGAKPFGGRIGPRIFAHEPTRNPTMIKPRNQGNYLLSSSYLSGLQPNLTSGFKPGLPIPIEEEFWVRTDSEAVGGSPTSSNKPKFAVPNIYYDFLNGTELNLEVNKLGSVEILKEANTWTEAYEQNQEDRGLFNRIQFEQFWNLQANSGSGTNNAVMSADQVEDSIKRARAPTKYDSLNYLIPSFADANTAGNNPFDTNPSFINQSSRANEVKYMIYAPLFGTFFPHNREIQGIKNEVTQYLTYNETAITTFNDSLKAVADAMIADSAGAKSPDAYVEAAKTIYNEPLDVVGAPTDPQCQKLSLAQQFNQFFKGVGEQCGIKPIKEYMESYLDEQRSANGEYQNYYTTSFLRLNQGETPPFDPNILMSAYSPGRRQGAEPNGTMITPSGVDLGIARRNVYSTKFVPVNDFLIRPVTGSGIMTLGLLHENDQSTVPDVTGLNIENKLLPDDLTEYSSIDF